MYSENSTFPQQHAKQESNKPELAPLENELLTFMASKPPESRIQGFNCAQWIRCKEIYGKLKNPDSPAEYIGFGSAGSGTTVWALCKTTDQNIYLIESQYGIYPRWYEKLSDESMVEDR